MIGAIDEASSRSVEHWLATAWVVDGTLGYGVLATVAEGEEPLFERPVLIFDLP